MSSKIFVTGDTHGEITRLISKQARQIKRGDYLIIAGDFGVVWFDESNPEMYSRQQKKLDMLNNLRYTVLFVDGNHLNFNELKRCPVIDYKEGKAHKLRDNVYHLMRGEIYNIADKKVFTFGGAESIDKSRRIENVSWWKQELPSSDEYENGLNNLDKHDWEVDFIITHDAPYDLLKKMDKYSWLQSYELNKFLQVVYDNCKFSKWYFGHHHQELDFGNIECVYKNIKEG